MVTASERAGPNAKTTTNTKYRTYHIEAMENTGKQGSMVTDEMIINRIYVLRGQKVMIDADLAALYQVDSAKLKALVTKNTICFPGDFMFQLTIDDYQSLRSQDSNRARQTLVRNFPRAFTEQGLAMLSGLLKTEEAIQVNIRIIRIFTLIRQILPDYPELRKEIEKFRNKLILHK